jgi:phosphatidate cytidylyltransferase
MVYVGGWVLVGAIVLLGAVGTIELFRLATKAGAHPMTEVGVVGAGAFPIAAYLLLQNGSFTASWALYLGVVWFMLVMATAVWTRPPAPGTLLTISVTAFAPVYTSALPSFILFLRHGVEGTSPIGATWLVFFPLAMTWVCDSFAMTGGSMFGGPKFAPVVSPRKTWSGAVSGLIGAVLVAFAFQFLVLSRVGIAFSAMQLVLLGLAVGVFGQIGDLAESLIKRSVGTKDSGRFFGEHGGVLDRLDSLYWVLPISSLLLFSFGVL